ncbi:MAG: YdcF family protein [Sulfurospirillaceae bacterium]|nr:YdcF family protein [Sulfurospirillaceae bacterium]
MYTVSKLFTYIFLPPGIFIIALLLAALYAKRFRSVFVSVALFFYLFSNSFVSDALMKPLESQYTNDLQITKNADAIVVLSGGSISGSKNLPLGSDSLKRVTWGVFLAKSQNLPLVFSGGGLNKQYSESKAFLESIKEFQDYLNIHIPISKYLQLHHFSVCVENKSLNTYQNAQFSKKIFEQANIQNPIIYLVTSAYHMKRAEMIFNHFGFRVIPAATDFKIGDNPKTIWDYFPNMQAFKNSYTAIHEYFGILSLILRKVL